MSTDDDRLFKLPKRIGAEDHLIGLGLAGVYVTWLIRTARVLGFARDEGFYFHAASDYQRWFEALLGPSQPGQAFQRPFIDGIWATNHEHPGLMKSLFALAHLYFFKQWHWFEDQSTAFRFPGMVMAGIALWVIYLWGARAYSRRAGLFAALLFALMPRVFYHAHLACFDVGITTMWVLCLYVYWRSIGQGFNWALLLGVVFGLALDTKHNAWILPFVILPHALFVNRRGGARGSVRLPLNVVMMLLVGPAVFIGLWPWLWNDTFPRIQEWMGFHLNHEYYNMEFLGRNYFAAPSPRTYMPVMIAATVPAVTLLLFFVGAFDRLKNAAARVFGAAPGDPKQTDLLIALGMLAALAPWILSAKTPIFGGTKHWMPAYPLMVLFAGRGLDVVATKAAAMVKEKALAVRRAAMGALYASVIAAPLALTIHSHPFGLTAYTPAVGGTQGAADLGLNRQFWGFTTESANLEYLAKNAPQNSSVFIHDTAWDSWMRMVDENRVRRDLRGVASPSEADFSLVHHELHMAEIDHHIWVAYGVTNPAYVVAHDGVPVVSVYRRPGR